MTRKCCASLRTLFVVLCYPEGFVIKVEQNFNSVFTPVH